jgi:hypothetical protein
VERLRDEKQAGSQDFWKLPSYPFFDRNQAISQQLWLNSALRRNPAPGTNTTHQTGIAFEFI